MKFNPTLRPAPGRSIPLTLILFSSIGADGPRKKKRNGVKWIELISCLLWKKQTKDEKPLHKQLNLFASLLLSHLPSITSLYFFSQFIHSFFTHKWKRKRIKDELKEGLLCCSLLWAELWRELPPITPHKGKHTTLLLQLSHCSPQEMFSFHSSTQYIPLGSKQLNTNQLSFHFSFSKRNEKELMGWLRCSPIPFVFVQSNFH